MGNDIGPEALAEIVALLFRLHTFLLLAEIKSVPNLFGRRLRSPSAFAGEPMRKAPGNQSCCFYDSTSTM
jgi:hypothetical protein